MSLLRLTGDLTIGVLKLLTILGNEFKTIKEAESFYGFSKGAIAKKIREGVVDLDLWVRNHINKSYYIKASSLEEVRLCVLNHTVENSTGCWIWQGSVNHSGYGMLNFNSKRTRVHRLSYTAFKGDIPEGLLIRHRCHTKRCCNPLHLEVGTNKDNMKDAVVDEVFSIYNQQGTANKLAVLTEEQVYELRIKYKTGKYSTEQLANEYGVERKNVSGSVNGTYYGCYQKVPPFDWRYAESVTFRSMLTWFGYDKVRELLFAGESVENVAKILQLPVMTVDKIKRGVHGHYDKQYRRDS